MATLKDLSHNIGAIALKVEENASETVRKVSLAVDQAIVSSTPVDTGRARSNWIVSLNHSVKTTIKPLAQGAAATAPSITRAAQKIATYKAGDRAIYIQNNLPYIQRLNEGWSKQAPANFVQIALMAGVKSIKGAKLIE